MINQGPTAQELKDAKTQVRGALTLAMENSSFLANYYGQQALFADKIKTPAEKLKEIDKVTAAQIKKVGREVYDFSQMRVAIIGNVEKEFVKF
jgi:predicted Zn-dependent peptidase